MVFGGISKIFNATTKAAIEANNNTGGGGPRRSALPHDQSAQYPSLQEFMAFSLKDKDYSPATTNLFSLHIVTPALMKNWTARDGRMGTDGREHIISDTIGYRDSTFMSGHAGGKGDKLGKCLNFYCQSVSTPSRQLTTGSLVNIGTATKYATGSAFSQISCTFIAPNSQHSLNFFERWLSLMAPDANQYTDYYDYYNAPRMMIYKWEKGGQTRSDWDQTRSNRGNENFVPNSTQPLRSHEYRLTASWELQQAFPYNIGSTQLNNAAARTMTFTVGFFFERYRFYTQPEFDEPGVRTQISIPGLGGREDDYYDPYVDAQQIFQSIDDTQKSLGTW